MGRSPEQDFWRCVTTNMAGQSNDRKTRLDEWAPVCGWKVAPFSVVLILSSVTIRIGPSKRRVLVLMICILCYVRSKVSPVNRSGQPLLLYSVMNKVSEFDDKMM